MSSVGSLPPSQAASSISLNMESSQVQPCVVEISYLNEINTAPSVPGREVRFVLDIDDTLHAHGKQGQFFSLGSRAWRKDFLSQIIGNLGHWLEECPDVRALIPHDHSIEKMAQNLHDYITWYLALRIPVQLIEPGTVVFIEHLQREGIDVSLCTSRQQDTWYWIKGLHVKEQSGLPVVNLTLDQKAKERDASHPKKNAEEYLKPVILDILRRYYTPQ